MTKKNLLVRGAVTAAAVEDLTNVPVYDINGDFMVVVSRAYGGYDGYCGYDGGTPPAHWGVRIIWVQLSPSLRTGMVCL